MAAAAPSIVSPARLARASPLTRWHLLSLDAPTVATLWMWFIARATRTPVPGGLLASMFLTVWILYAVDRLLDSNGARTQSAQLQPRHLFHWRHRRAFTAAILAAASALIPALAAIPSRALHLYLALAAVLLVWFGLIHTCKVRLPKELAIGFFFAAAVFIPSVRLSSTLLLPAVLFANLCSLNCLHIYAWEHREPAGDAHSSTRFGLRIRPPLTLLSTAVPLALLGLVPAPIRLVLIAIALASALLFALDRVHRRLDPTGLRAAADLALLTPVLVLPFLP